MSTGASLWSALIAAVTALVVFVLTQWAVGRREKHTRSDERRRSALRDAQDAALALRTALAEFGPLARRALGTVPSGDLVTAQQHADAAFAALEVRLTRLEDDSVRTAVTRWRERARFHYISAEEVTTAEESALWQAMNDAIGQALRP